MITALNTFIYDYGLIINLIAHFLIFLGSFYVALQNRNLPQWHITPLWYVGLCSILVCMTIIVQWVAGTDHPLSYWNSGKLAETSVNIAVATVATIMLIGTVRKDLRESRKRRQREKTK